MVQQVVPQNQNHGNVSRIEPMRGIRRVPVAQPVCVVRYEE